MTVENPNLSLDNPDNIKSINWRKKAAIGSVALASTLALAKFFTYIMTGSIAMMTSLADSSIDLLSASITLCSVISASLPPNKKHRYGFDKFESIAAFAQSVFISVSGGYLLIHSIQRLVDPKEIVKFDLAIGTMLFSIFLTGSLVLFQRYVIKKTNSLAIRADSANYKGDLYMNIAVIISLVATKYTGIIHLDALFGILVSLMLFRNAYEIFKDSLAVLVDKELSEEERSNIINIIRGCSYVLGVHDLRTRNSGYRSFIEVHIELPGDMDLFKVHDVTEDIETEIYKAYPDAEIVIHPEPHGIDDYRRDHKIENISAEEK